MRVLIVEAEEHFFLTNTSVELLGPLGDVRVVLSRGLSPGNTSVKNWREMLSDDVAERVVARSRHRWIFLTSLPRALQSDLVFVQTGPEHGSMVKILTYLLFCFINGRRTVVTLHGITAHTPGVGARGRLRTTALRRVRGIVYGTEDMRRRHALRLTWIESEQSATTVVPVRLAPDPPPPPAPHLGPAERLRVGLVGGVTHKRQDFGLIMAALDRLTPDERDALEFVTVGNCTKARCREITASLSERVVVDVEPGHLSESRLIQRGASCHVLLAAMSPTLDYGSGRATGALGDALRMGRPLLISASMDPAGEYTGIAHRFWDAAGLEALLRSALHSTPAIDPAVLRGFSAPAVLKRFCTDIGIQHPSATP